MEKINAQLSRIQRLDRLIAAVIILLIVAVGALIWSGDQVGFSISEYGPMGRASGGDAIRILFSEAASRSSVEERFTIEPDVPGQFSWAGSDTLLFTPDGPWTAGQSYTVTVGQGARAESDRSLLRDLVWTFTVRLPRALYLAPADKRVTNIYMSDLETGDVYQLTDSDRGVEDFAVSPDGGQIAYSHNNEDGTSNIWILDMNTQNRWPVTNCVNARCYNPSWNIEHDLLAYQRDDFNPSVDAEQSRVWVVDLKTLNTRLLFDDPQILGDSPIWSPDGVHIGLFDPSLPGIRIYNYDTQTDEIIDSIQGIVGFWSPDGRKLVYPVLTRGLIGEQFYTYLEMVDFEGRTTSRISGPEDIPVEDKEGAWSPDGQSMAVARRYLDDRFTRGAQIYLLNPITAEAEPLVVDAEYHHAVISWDAAGQRLIYQRFSLIQQEAVPEIWTYDLSTGESKLIAANAYLPHWLP